MEDGLDVLGDDSFYAGRRKKFAYRGATIGAVLANVGLHLFGWKYGVTKRGPLHWSFGPRPPSFLRFLVATTTGAAVGAGSGYAASRLTEETIVSLPSEKK